MYQGCHYILEEGLDNFCEQDFFSTSGRTEFFFNSLHVSLANKTVVKAEWCVARDWWNMLHLSISNIFFFFYCDYREMHLSTLKFSIFGFLSLSHTNSNANTSTNGSDIHMSVWNKSKECKICSLVLFPRWRGGHTRLDHVCAFVNLHVVLLICTYYINFVTFHGTKHKCKCK